MYTFHLSLVFTSCQFWQIYGKTGPFVVFQKPGGSFQKPGWDFLKPLLDLNPGWDFPKPWVEFFLPPTRRHISNFEVCNFVYQLHFLVFFWFYTELYTMRASGLIPVIPLIVINKDTQLPMYIEGQAIIY